MGVDLISSEINVIGNLVGSYSDLVALMALAAQQKVSLHTAKYPMDEFQRALDDLGAGRVRGRAILVPPDRPGSAGASVHRPTPAGPSFAGGSHRSGPGNRRGSTDDRGRASGTRFGTHRLRGGHIGTRTRHAMVTTVRGAFTDIGGKAHLVPADPPASSVSIRAVTVDFTLTGSAKDPWGNVRVGFEGAPAINRSEWGLTRNTALDTGGVLVSDRIQIEFDVSAVRNS